MTGFWSAWIIVLTVITLILLTWLLFATRKMKSPIDEGSAGHEYDGIIEEDNPLPGWWFSMFVMSLLFAVGYLIAYPGLGNFPGLLGWTSMSEHDERVAEVKAAFATSTAEFNGLSITELTTNKKANNMGRRLFANNCAVCHGSAGVGSYGFPQLSDNEWQWGGTDEQIIQTITHGRTAAMPAWKAALGAEKTKHVVSYVQDISTGADKPNEEGAAVFQTYCVACHGADGSGNQMLGSPSLVDDVWLYGNTESQLTATISSGRSGKMPAHAGLLSEEKIKLIVAYVRSLNE